MHILPLFIVLTSEGPPNKRPKINNDNARKEKKSRSPTREHRKSETEVTVEVKHYKR